MKKQNWIPSFLVALFLSPMWLVASDALPRVRSNIAAVRNQVAGEDRAEAWEERIGLKELASEIENGEDADLDVVGKSISGLADHEQPIDRERANKLRTAVAKWLEDADKEEEPAVVKEGGLQLGPPDGDDGDGDSDDENLDDADEEEGDEDDSDADEDDDSDKDGDDDVDAAREKLEDDEEEGFDEELAEAVLEAAEDLEEWLKRTDADGWLEVLALSDIIDAAEDPESADEEAVGEWLSRFDAELAQADRASFVRLRRSLEDLRDEIEFPIEEECARIARRAVSDFREIDEMRLANAKNRLRTSLMNLNNFLATGSTAKLEGWTAFLLLEDLNEAVEASGTPIVGTLVRSFNKFNSGEAGLELSQFKSVRDDLESYVEQLTYAERTPARLAAARRDLQVAVDELGRFLDTTNEEKRNAWKEFLEWETLEAQLEEELPDFRALKEVQDQFDSEENGLDLPVYRNVGLRVAKLRELARLQSTNQAEDIYRNRMERLAQTLERHELSPTNETSAELFTELKWLEATGFAPGIAGCVRGNFDRPNFFAAVSGQFVTNLLNDQITDATPINRCFEGSRVRGCARTSAQVTAQLIPSPTGVIIDVLLSGQTISTSTAQQRRVYVGSRGTTNITARKRLYGSLDGLYAEPAKVDASTCARQTGVCIDRNCNLGNRLITRIAGRRFEESRCKAQGEQTQEAKDTISRRMDDEASQMIAQSNQRLRDARANLQQRLSQFPQLRPESINLRSTAEKILADGKLAVGGLGAPSDPPQIGCDSDLVLQVHQSAVNGLLRDLFGGVKLDNERMVSMMEEMNLPVPDELKISPKKPEEPTPADDADDDADDEDADEDEEEVDDESWSITFDRLQPASIDLTDGLVRISIRGRRFEQGDQDINDPIEISASYRLREDRSGLLEARLVGDVDIVFVGKARLNTRQLAVKTFIKRKIKPLFRRKFSIDDLPEGQLKDQARSLKVDEIETTRGWLAIALSLEELASNLQLTMNQ